MNILRNRYVRVAISAIVGSYMAPKIQHLTNWAMVPELGPVDGWLNDVEYYSVVGIVAGMSAVILGAAFGVPEPSETTTTGAAA